MWNPFKKKSNGDDTQKMGMLGRIAEKETVLRHHKFKVDPDLPDGTEGNEFEIEWEEDHIISYKMPKMFALKRPTWDINPTRKIEDFTPDFYTDPTDALSRFACMPPDATDAFFNKLTW